MKVVPYLKLFLSIFYLKFLKYILNPFEINLIRFENRIGRTVLPTPPVSAAPNASPRCPAPHPATDDRAPVASRPTCQPRRPTSRRPRRSPLSHGNALPAPTPRRCAAPCCARAPLSLLLRLHVASTPPAPSPPLLVKTEPPPTGRNFFLTPRAVRLVRPRPSAARSSPSPRRPPRWFSATGAPPPCQTPSSRHRRPPPLR
jgi:hypothetical protein